MATKGQSGESDTYYSVPGEGDSTSGGTHIGGSADSAVEARPPDLADSGWHPSDGSNPDGRYYDTGTTEYVDDSGNYRITMYQHASDRAALRIRAEMDRTFAAAKQNPRLSALGLPPQPDYYRNATNDQAEQLARGLWTREPPSLPKSLYTNVDHPTMQRMVTEDVDPGVVGEAGDLWSKTGNQLIDFQRVFAQAISKSESDWSGAAGDRAREFTAKMANWVGEAGRGAALSGTQMAAHAEALSIAKNNMPEPVTFDIDAANARLQHTSDPLQAITQRAEDIQTYHRQQEAQQQAARVMRTFDTTLGGAVTMPAFGEPPTFGGGGERATEPSTHPGDDARGQTVGPPQSGHAGGSEPTRTVKPGTAGNGVTPALPGRHRQVSGPGAAAVPGAFANDRGVRPTPVEAGTNPTAYDSGGAPATPGTPALPGVGGTVTGSGPGGANTGAALGAVPLGGAGVGSGGIGGSGGAAAKGLSDTLRGSPGGAGGAGGRMGAGAPGALAAEQAAARAGVTGGRGGGPMGGPMAGGGRGGRDKDTEHQSPSFLVEADPNELFGTDERTAPPVIGE